MAHQAAWRRHLPFAVFLFALASLILALARPTVSMMLPSNNATILLAFDVSRSMCSTDIQPNRLEAAKQAALSFIERQERGRKIGIVAFAGFAELVQPPTEDRAALANTIKNLVTARRTAIGSAILRSLGAIAEIDPNVMPGDTGDIPEGAFTPVPDGEYVPHIIVLLTDGASNAGPSPISAAIQAEERGVRVFTIGFGTRTNASPMNCFEPFQDTEQFGPGSNPFGGGSGGGGFRREIDEETLTTIADLTGGAYYAATSANELEDVFADLPTNLTLTRETVEISALFTVFAALLVVLALILSLRLYPLG
jgi:Ca-activated chloride channel family protein